MRTHKSCVECEVKGPHCFCTLDSVALKRLDSLGHNVQLPSGRRVFLEGGPPDKVFVVCSGILKLTTTSSDGRVLILRVAGQGDVLGLSAAMRRSPYEAGAETIEPCHLKAIPRAQFLLFLEEFQAVSRNSAMAVARQYGSVVVSARRLALSTNAAARLAAVLLDWARVAQPGDSFDDVCAPSSKTASFVMPLSHEELGQMAGLSRETVTRVLSTFRRDGLLRVEGDRMMLPDTGRLMQLAV